MSNNNNSTPDRYDLVPLLPGQTPKPNSIMTGTIRPVTEFLRIRLMKPHSAPSTTWPVQMTHVLS
jgi:hypothetical protein